MDSLNELAVEYQRLLLEEKRVLLEIEECRRSLISSLDLIIESKLLRSVKRDTIREAIAKLQDGNGAYDIVLGIPLKMEIWIAARKKAQNCPPPKFDVWKKKFDESCVPRNQLIEHLAQMIPKVRRNEFWDLPESCSDDCESAGLMRLFNAIENYSPDKGSRIESHAYNWIKEGMQKWIEKSDYVKALNARKGLASEKEAEDSTILILDEVQEILRDEGASNPFDAFDRKATADRLVGLLKKAGGDAFFLASTWPFGSEEALDAPVRNLEEGKDIMAKVAAGRVLGRIQ